MEYNFFDCIIYESMYNLIKNGWDFKGLSKKIWEVMDENKIPYQDYIQMRRKQLDEQERGYLTLIEKTGNNYKIFLDSINQERIFIDKKEKKSIPKKIPPLFSSIQVAFPVEFT